MTSKVRTIEDLFSDQNEEDVFHDTVLDATGQSMDHAALMVVFKTLPKNLQSLAMQWHIGDTDFNEMALNFLCAHCNRKTVEPAQKDI